jgi:hypothetical protein
LAVQFNSAGRYGGAVLPLTIPILIALAAPAEAPLDLSGAKADQGCKAAEPGEVLVCGDRGPSPYRLDPTVLQADRAKEAASNPVRVEDRSGNANLCGTVRDECGGGMIPILGPALRVADAVVKAAEGEDWREAFRNGPSDYQRYQEAKRKKPSISVGVSVTNDRNR